MCQARPRRRRRARPQRRSYAGTSGRCPAATRRWRNTRRPSRSCRDGRRRTRRAGPTRRRCTARTHSRCSRCGTGASTGHGSSWPGIGCSSTTSSRSSARRSCRRGARLTGRCRSGTTARVDSRPRCPPRFAVRPSTGLRTPCSSPRGRRASTAALPFRRRWRRRPGRCGPRALSAPANSEAVSPGWPSSPTAPDRWRISPTTSSTMRWEATAASWPTPTPRRRTPSSGSTTPTSTACGSSGPARVTSSPMTRTGPARRSRSSTPTVSASPRHRLTSWTSSANWVTRTRWRPRPARPGWAGLRFNQLRRMS